jgi:hypothetical protein
MFCQECGQKFESDSKFCGRCGTPRRHLESQPEATPIQPDFDSAGFKGMLEDKASQYFDNPEFTAVPKEYLASSDITETEKWVSAFIQQKFPFSVGLEGFVNAEVGTVWFSTKPLYSCDDCHQEVTYDFIQVDCSSCGKTPENFCSAPIGKGDGTYPVYQVEPSTGTSFLAVLATEAGEDGQGAITDLLSKVLAQDFSAIGTREAMVKVPIMSLLTVPEYLATKVGKLTVQAQDVTSGNISLPGLSQVIVSSPRSKKHLDAAEVRIGWSPGEYEIIAITRAATLQRVTKELDSPGGEVPYFERPEVLAVLVVPADEVSDLFPPFKRIVSAQELRLFERSDRWIELSRPLHGYLFAIWANWEMMNNYLGTLEEGDWTLSNLFRFRVSDGYLHQIWNILTTQPPTLADQLSVLGNFRSSFEELAGYSTEPGHSVTRSDLRDWFLQDQ